MKPHRIALALLTLGTTACETVDSSDLLTGGMSAVISAEADGSGETDVSAVLRAGGMRSNVFVDLLGDDELTATTGETTQELSRAALGNLISYNTSFDVDAAGTEFTIALNRSIDPGAPASTVSLPEAFEFGTTADAFDPNTNLAFDWTPASTDAEMEVIVDGDCIVLWAEELSGDPGSFEIPGDEISVIGDEAGTSCAVDVTVRRVIGGQLDSAYEEGLVQGVQVRTFEATFSQ